MALSMTRNLLVLFCANVLCRSDWLRTRSFGFGSNELDGYNNSDELPDYRTINSISRGFFVGIAGAQINDQPLNLWVMEEKHRKLVDKVRLAQPAASYEGSPDKSAGGSLP
jgi:AbiTii